MQRRCGLEPGSKPANHGCPTRNSVLTLRHAARADPVTGKHEPERQHGNWPLTARRQRQCCPAPRPGLAAALWRVLCTVKATGHAPSKRMTAFKSWLLSGGLRLHIKHK